MGTWEPVRTADGTWTLRHPVHGQACHSLAGAWQESLERYAQACGLRERARPGEALHLLDVGTGLGLNLAAALATLAGSGARLVACTLERDRSVLEALADLPPGPPEVERWHAPVRAALLAAARGASGRPVRLALAGLPAGAPDAHIRLALGDARQTLPGLAGEAPFDAVFLDPFSPKVEGELWSAEFLAQVAARMADHGMLSTYSVARGVRRGLAAAGLRVGQGPAVGTKRAGTLASRRGRVPPLDERAGARLAGPGMP